MSQFPSHLLGPLPMVRATFRPPPADAPPAGFPPHATTQHPAWGTAPPTRPLPPRPRPRRPWFLRRWVIITALVTVLAMLSAIFAVGAVIYYGPATLVEPAPLLPAVLVDVNGQPLGQIRPEERRIPVPLTDVPRHVQDAFVAGEDHRFWKHRGVDPLAIVNAALSGLGGRFRGASTITQQYVKISVVGGERTMRRKVREAVTAVRLERRYPKEKILEAYLNSIYLGHGAYGIEAAAQTYFGRPAKRLTLAQGALLAGLTPAPSRLSPRTNRREALERRDLVLDRMTELGMIGWERADSAKREPLRLVRTRLYSTREPLFTDWLRRELEARVGEDRLYRAGLRVQTTLDLGAQRAAERTVSEVLGRPSDPDVAVVAVDVASGEVRVMVGGRDARPGDFNLATMARRQAGSTFKPIVLAAALENGKSIDDVYPAPSRVRLRFPGRGAWSVANYDRRGYGALTLRRGLAYSVNTVYARLMRDVGPKKVVRISERLGFRSLRPIPSLALGTEGVSALEMAAAFAAFGNGGTYHPPTAIRLIEDRDSQLVRTKGRNSRRAISRRSAEGVRKSMQAVIEYGTGRRIEVKDPKAAGKTGTSEDFRDAWFVGLAGGHAIAVWVGYAKRERPMRNVRGVRVVGGSFPGTIWSRVANELIARSKPREAPPCAAELPDVLRVGRGLMCYGVRAPVAESDGEGAGDGSSFRWQGGYEEDLSEDPEMWRGEGETVEWWDEEPVDESEEDAGGEPGTEPSPRPVVPPLPSWP